MASQPVVSFGPLFRGPQKQIPLQLQVLYSKYSLLEYIPGPSYLIIFIIIMT